MEHLKNLKKKNLFKKLNYQPIEKAIQVHNSDKDIVVVQAPSRAAKSSTFVPEAIYTFMQPKTNIWVVGIDYKNTDRFVFGSGLVKGINSFCKEYLPFLIGSGGEHKRDHELENQIGSTVKGKSVKYPDSFVAEPVDLIVCEDAISYPEGFYDQHIRARILDTKGRILINSVPPVTIKNWVSKLANREGVDSFHWSLYDKTHLDKKTVEDYIRDCPSHLHRAYVEGLPPTEDSSVFGNLKDRIMQGFIPYQKDHVYQAGVDIGKVHDRTVLSISDLTIGRLVFIDRFPPRFFKTELVEQRLLHNLGRYGYPNTFVDTSGIGEKFSDMVSSHPFFIPYPVTNLKTRNFLIEELAQAFQREYTIPNFKPLLDELENLDIVFRTGYHIYKAKFYDDSIISAALSVKGWMGMNSQRGKMPTPIEVKGAVAEDDFLSQNSYGFLDLVGDYIL